MRPLEPSLQLPTAVADDLGAAAALEAYAPPSAERVYVGKRGGRPSIKQVQAARPGFPPLHDAVYLFSTEAAFLHVRSLIY